MKLTLLSLLLLSLVVSCGGDNDDNDDKAASTPTEREEDTNNNDNTNEDDDRPEMIRYSQVEQLFVCGLGSDCRFSIIAPLNRRPVVLASKFSDGELGSCSFNVTLTDTQAQKLESRADKIRTCKLDSPIVIDASEDVWILTDKEGNSIRADKYHMDAQTQHQYICKGRSGYESYIKSLIRDKVPENCPDSYYDALFSAPMTEAAD